MASKTSKSDLSGVHIAILAGGSGTRLWPRSRRRRPKQLLNLVGKRSLLQQTISRALSLVPLERIYVLTGPEHAPLVAQHIPQMLRSNIFVEPSPRGTAPSLGLAAVRLRGIVSSGQEVMVSLHADHTIAREERFRAALVAAVATARRGFIATVGVVPSYPETGFGYIERGQPLGRELGQDIYRVERFTEKPTLGQAREFVASGRFYWNTGYFAWTLEHILEEYRRLLPEMYSLLNQVAELAGFPADSDALERLWNQIAPTTIDVGIMERSSNVAVVPCDLGWSDIGNWSAMFDILPHDEQHNVVLGNGEHVGLDTSNSLVYTEGGRLVATIGLEGMIVVDTGDAVLVLPKSRAQEVSALVKALRERGLGNYL